MEPHVLKVEQLNSEGAVDLCLDDLQSGVQFWVTVLAYATKEDAESIRYVPALGESCLVICIKNEQFEYEAPEESLRFWLLEVGRDLAAGSRWRGKLWNWMSRLFQRSMHGQVTVELPEFQSRWKTVFCQQELVFQKS